jgi:hypothetical protein
LLADIVQGKTAGGDVFFLLGVIFAVLAAIMSWVRYGAGSPNPPAPWPWSHVLGWLAVGCISFGLLLQ